jgi:pre-mRNA-splicing factor 38B
MKKYILEEDELQLSLDRSKTITVGEFIEQLLTDQQYFSTRLPRIPQQHETRIQAMIIVAREKRQRRVINQRLSELFVTGVPVRAISSIDDEWYIGVIERFEGRVLLVRFTEKNVIEPVDLGEVELMPDDEEGTQ